MLLRKLLKIVLYLCWLVVSVILLLFAVEYACRWLVPSWLPYQEDRSKVWQYDSDLGWSQKPNHKTIVRYPQFTISVSTNSMGLRDREYSLERTDKKRMLIIGDSFVWGFGVEDQQRFTELLEQRHPDWEIINAGTSGYGTDQEYLYYMKRGRYLKPDVVVLLLYCNDFENNYSKEQYFYHKPYFTLDGSGQLVVHNQPVPQSTLTQRYKRFMETETVFLRRLESFIQMVSYFIRWAIDEKSVSSYMGGFLHWADSFPVTNALLREFKNAVAANQSEFIIFSSPVRRGLTVNLNELTRDGSWNYLDLDPVFVGKEKETMIPHDIHWNATGHLLAADAMEKYLQQKGIFR